MSKPCRFDVFPSQNNACIRVILEEYTDGRVQGKPKVNEYFGSRRIRRGEKHNGIFCSRDFAFLISFYIFSELIEESPSINSDLLPFLNLGTRHMSLNKRLQCK